MKDKSSHPPLPYQVRLPAKSHTEDGHPTECLNCSHPLYGKFCAHCGQSANTHRMSFKHFIMHDIVHGIWHVDKGLLFTLRNILLYPGRSAKAYLSGKRVGYFNLLTLLIFMVAFFLYLSDMEKGAPFLKASKGFEEIVKFINSNIKWVILSSCFVFGLSSFAIFRRWKFNYTEHLIINGFLLVGIILINIISQAFRLFAHIKLSGSALIAMLIYTGYTYFQAFQGKYSIAGWIWRYLVHIITSLILFLVVTVAGLLIYALVAGKDGIEGSLML